ncbi:NAD-glutamate dehydrogenase [Granulosicoccaceae sp. 1_MG-2023]|nr:NAD-glutamate dehydrogenase [Granulosicoccaceae sp. 1_MG-2023]
MINRTTTANDIIGNLTLTAGEDLPAELLDQARQFIALYYDDVSLSDLEKLKTMDLRGAALAHWMLMRERRPGEPKVHVYNPNFEHHGWQSTHTIIEVVTDDVPMLVNSLSMAIKQRDLEIHLIVHPIMQVVRDDKGVLLDLPEGDSEGDSHAESVMQFQIDRVTGQAALEDLQKAALQVIDNARAVFEDRPAMQSEMLAHAKAIRTRGDDHNEAAELLEWLAGSRFVFLGSLELELQSQKADIALVPVPGSGLGLCRPEKQNHGLAVNDVIPADSISFIHSAESVSMTKTSVRSPLHRADHMDLISLPRLDSEGHVTGKYCFLGLLTSAVYNASGGDIPFLRTRINHVMEASRHRQGSHAARALQNILETFPRDTLFHADEDSILKTAQGILQLQDRKQVRLFTLMDKYDRFCDCLVYIPREVYHRDLRVKIEQILLEQLQGDSVEFNIEFSSESALARIHYVVQFKRNLQAEPDWREVEKAVANAGRSWDDDFHEALQDYFGEERGNALFKRYQYGIPGNYKEDFPARNACVDIEHIEALESTGSISLSVYRPVVAGRDVVKSKIFTLGQYIALSDVIPVIENMGLKVVHERPYEFHRADGDSVWIHEFTTHHAAGLEIDPDVIGENFKDAFKKIWHGEIENDGFNRLVLDADLNWKQALMLRSYCKYLLQIRVPFSQSYMIETLVSNAAITRNLVALFETRFDPLRQSTAATHSAKLIEQLEYQLQDVKSLDEDRILHAYINLIQATKRTNFYRRDKDGKDLPYLSYKLSPREINDMPRPRPLFDIFVYSPRVEGVHLRGGKVARGGLRWSDRREDFRTEVLGLVKAQTVKNAVIVPVGSKGGFIVKNPPVGAAREVLMEEVIYCYKTFLRGLLDLTDNMQGSAIIPPPQVVRYDGDDPYLVVAADKGTATFSDIANGVAAEYNYWLGDAFASGGSVGYDHKKMGITARGAWESVKRHFRELGRNIQTEPFTVVGIGDMSGDVFGNGMLLSEQIKLIGAFNHLHIFIDPDPDPAVSFKERQRLFSLPRSTWDDYDKSLLSEGGGVYPRSAKSIKLSDAARQALGIEETSLTPNQLIQCLLRAPVDLVWNGGIGTYIKSSKESHDDASDRSNDNLRVDADQLRCKVIGEGGNLGVTQLARIEFARNGGACFTDAVDNSAGVDCSDHEVNIKILVDQMVQAGDMTAKHRNQLLADMTDEVASLVLRDNYLQTQCISISASLASQQLEEHARFMSHLESHDLLDRAIEFLPDHESIAERLADQKGLVRPELAVLVSYAKMTLFDEVVASTLPDDPYLHHRLGAYFPHRIRDNYPEQIGKHRLHREIIATCLVNEVVNRLGPTFVFRITDELGVAAADVCKAYEAAVAIFDMQSLWHDIEALDNKAPDRIQQELLILVGGLVERSVHWLLRTRRYTAPVEELVSFFRPAIGKLLEGMPACLAQVNRDSLEARCNYFVDNGADADLAMRAARVVPLSSSLDLVEIADSTMQAVDAVAAVYFELGARLDLQWLRDEIAELRVRNRWHTLAKSSLRSDLHYQQRHLTADVIANSKDISDPVAVVSEWAGAAPEVDNYLALITELKASSSVDFAMLSLAVNEVHKLLRSDRPLSGAATD